MASCKKFPAFSACPPKTVIGDHVKHEEKKETTQQAADEGQ
jgi:hypothetical protein